MAKTIDECLAEVDTWKQAVQDEMRDLSPEQCAQKYEESLEWLFSKIGPLERVPFKPDAGAAREAPGAPGRDG